MIDPDHPWQHDDLSRGTVHDAYDGYGHDARLLHQVYVDGRLVDSWTGSVQGSAWQHWADRFEDERRPLRPAPAPAPPDPQHVRVLRWLEGLAGGHAALMELTDEPPAPSGLPAPEDPPLVEAHDQVGAHLDRVCSAYFDQEVRDLCERGLRTVLACDPRLATRTHANELAGGLLWLVGRANRLFTGGVTQVTIQRELWLKKQLSVCGQALRHCLAGVDVHAEPRPPSLPDLRTYGCGDLLTGSTRRLVLRWRDEALAAQAAAAPGGDG